MKQNKKDEFKLVLEPHELRDLEIKLRYRFNFLQLIDCLGIDVAKGAIEPGPTYCWPKLYMMIYNSPEA